MKKIDKKVDSPLSMIYNIIMVYLRTLGKSQNNDSLAENHGKQAGLSFV